MEIIPIYQKSDKIVLRCSRMGLQCFKEKGYFVASAEDGAYRLFKPTIAIIRIRFDDKHVEDFNVKKFMCKKYHKAHPTKSALMQLVNDLKNGVISLDELRNNQD